MSSALSTVMSGISLMGDTPSTGRANLPGGQKTAGGINDFNELLSSLQVSPEALARLQELLPTDQFGQLQALMESGNGLPLSADFAGEADLLGNPALVQWMLQLLETGATGIAARGAGHSAGSAISLADLKGALMGQVAGGGTANGADGGNPKSDQAPLLLLAKGDSPLPIQALKSTPLSADLMPGLTQQTGSGMSASFSSMLAGVEHSATQRLELNAPPPLNQPPGAKGWENLISNRIMWMVGKQMQQASLQITPRHLGPIDIQVSVQNDLTSVTFTAQNGFVKEALEAAIPRMREMFQENNLQLANVDVGQRESGDQKGTMDLSQQPGHGSSGSLDVSGGAETDTDELATHRYISSGLVDDYA